VPELEPLVTFQRRDLTRGLPPVRLRHHRLQDVLIYFGDEAQERLVKDCWRAH